MWELSSASAAAPSLCFPSSTGHMWGSTRSGWSVPPGRTCHLQALMRKEEPDLTPPLLCQGEEICSRRVRSCAKLKEAPDFFHCWLLLGSTSVFSVACVLKMGKALLWPCALMWGREPKGPISVKHSSFAVNFPILNFPESKLRVQNWCIDAIGVPSGQHFINKLSTRDGSTPYSSWTASALATVPGIPFKQDYMDVERNWVQTLF